MIVHEYLKGNNCKLNLDKLDSFEMLKEEIPKYDVFFTGEEHGIAANSALQFAFLKFFVLTIDICQYLCYIDLMLDYLHYTPKCNTLMN